MWNSIIEELRVADAVGDAFPIACFHHPEAVAYASKPGQLPRLAPDGQIYFRI